jgi:hypothetical protein
MPETQFTIGFHHRHSLRSWLRGNFPFLDEKRPDDYSPSDLAALERRAMEIFDACSTVESIDVRARSAYVKYYEEDWVRITAAVAYKEYRMLGGALEALLDAIDVE